MLRRGDGVQTVLPRTGLWGPINVLWDPEKKVQKWMRVVRPPRSGTNRAESDGDASITRRRRQQPACSSRCQQMRSILTKATHKTRRQAARPPVRSADFENTSKTCESGQNCPSERSEPSEPSACPTSLFHSEVVGRRRSRVKGGACRGPMPYTPCMHGLLDIRRHFARNLPRCCSRHKMFGSQGVPPPLKEAQYSKDGGPGSSFRCHEPWMSLCIALLPCGPKGTKSAVMTWWTAVDSADLFEGRLDVLGRFGASLLAVGAEYQRPPPRPEDHRNPVLHLGQLRPSHPAQ